MEGFSFSTNTIVELFVEFRNPGNEVKLNTFRAPYVYLAIYYTSIKITVAKMQLNVLGLVGILVVMNLIQSVGLDVFTACCLVLLCARKKELQPLLGLVRKNPMVTFSDTQFKKDFRFAKQDIPRLLGTDFRIMEIFSHFVALFLGGKFQTYAWAHSLSSIFLSFIPQEKYFLP